MYRSTPESGSQAGFTLIEVLAALLISAVALTYLLQSETASVRMASRTQELRQATILGSAKLQELIAGVETADSGDFEAREGWSWEAGRESFEGGFGTERVVLTVYYTSTGIERSLILEQVVR